MTWQCKRCRDRGEIPTWRNGETVHVHCPECNSDGDAFAPYGDDAIDMTDYGDGLPVQYAKEVLYGDVVR